MASSVAAWSSFLSDVWDTGYQEPASECNDTPSRRHAPPPKKKKNLADQTQNVWRHFRGTEEDLFPQISAIYITLHRWSNIVSHTNPCLNIYWVYEPLSVIHHIIIKKLQEELESE